MDSVFGLIFVGVIFYFSWKLISNMIETEAKRQGITARELWNLRLRSSIVAPESNVDKALNVRESRAWESERRHDEPRIHSGVIRKTLPFLPLVFMPVILTVVFTQDPLAIILIASQSILVTLAMGVYFHRQARRTFNIISDATDKLGSEELKVPEDWVEKYS